jgi:hypothetical protein
VAAANILIEIARRSAFEFPHIRTRQSWYLPTEEIPALLAPSHVVVS